MHISLKLTLFISTCKHVYRSTQCSLYTAVFLSVFLEHGPVLVCVLLSTTRDRSRPLSSTIWSHLEMESSTMLHQLLIFHLTWFACLPLTWLVPSQHLLGQTRHHCCLPSSSWDLGNGWMDGGPSCCSCNRSSPSRGPCHTLVHFYLSHYCLVGLLGLFLYHHY